MHLTAPQLATILAALRYWQEDLDANEDPPISEYFTEHPPLTAEEIDDLCEELNIAGPACEPTTADSETRRPGQSESPLLPDSFHLELQSATLGDYELPVPEELRLFARQHFGAPDSIVIGLLYEDECMLYLDEQIPDERRALKDAGWPDRFIDFLCRVHAEYSASYIRLV